MNAGRDVERLIASWLVEEAPGRAPDRVLDAAGLAIDRTNQRRFVAEWREPMYVTLRGLVAAAAVTAVVVGGAAFLFRAGQVGQINPTPTAPASSTPSESPDALAELAAYRASRDAICGPAMEQLLALFAALPSGPSTDEQAANLDLIITLSAQEIDDLAAIDAPLLLADEHAIDVQRKRDGLVLIGQIRDFLREGKQLEANAVDQAIAPLSALAEEYEAKYALKPCP